MRELRWGLVPYWAQDVMYWLPIALIYVFDLGPGIGHG